MNTMVRCRWERVGLGVVAGVLALASSVSTASAVYPGDNGRIAFAVKAGDGSTTIRTVLPDGTDQQTLGPGLDPSWSPDGKRIAFVNSVGGQMDLFVMDADGGNVQRVTTTPERWESSPSFAPGGQRIVYSRVAYGKPFAIGSIALDGSNYKRLALGTEPEFSPGGKRIAYVADGISIMWRDGTGQRQLVGTSDERLVDGPSFSPDGKRVLYGWRVCDPWCFETGADSVRRDGSDLHKVCGADDATYSPDGSRLAYQEPIPNYVGDPRATRGANIWTATTRIGVYPSHCQRNALTAYQKIPGRHFASDPSWQPVPGE